MNNDLFRKIEADIKDYILRQAERNDWVWFYDLHQKEVLRCAEKILKLYKADR